MPALLGLAVLASGCGGPSKQDRFVLSQVQQGRYGDAREVLTKNLEKNKSSRRYMLDRMQLSMVALADGLPDATETINDEIWEILRTQGINADKTVASVVINERVKFWKGEPFEQAMMLCYIAIAKAWRGEWDNTQAAAKTSLFNLADFGANAQGRRKSAQEIAATAYQEERRDASQDFIGHGYTPVKTNFALGYLLSGVANAALGRKKEASDNYDEANLLVAGLKDLVKVLKEERYNTVMVVDYGLGPTKTSYGPDHAFCRFVPKADWSSDARPLLVLVNGTEASSVPPVCDLNLMAADHMWNNLEDVRLAKSILGNALVVGGLTAANQSNDLGGQLGGLAVAGVGVLLKLSAHADTQHCMLLPQRVYVVALNVLAPNSTWTLQVEGDAASEMVLPGLSPPAAPDRVQLRYVRLTPWHAAEGWQRAGQVRYANDAYPGRVAGGGLPYILGGRCVRKPSHAALLRYQEAGHLRDMTVAGLEELYRLEGIKLTLEEAGGCAGRHVLEGGDSLECPRTGSAGFERLFCQDHAPYQPRSEKVRDMAAREAARGGLAAAQR